MTKPDQSLDLDHVQGTALAALLLSSQTLRFLRHKGLLEQAEVDLLMRSVLSNLEKNEFVSEPATHAARALLSGMATSLGVAQKPSN